MSQHPNTCGHAWTAWEHHGAVVRRQCTNCLIKEISEYYRCNLAGHIFGVASVCLDCGEKRAPAINALP